MKIIAIIQARMKSSRFPGKVLEPIGDDPMLAWVIERTRLAKCISSIVIATTTDPTDDPIEEFCAERNFSCFRGSMFDVLDRYYQAARINEADVIIRITADCPLIDPQLIDELVCSFLNIPTSELENTLAHRKLSTDGFPYDFAANRLPPPWGRTYPIGLDTEVCTFQALEIAWKEAHLPHQREHVMPFFYENPQRFRILHLNYHQDYGKLRWTVDTPEDLKLLQKLITLLPNPNQFSWLDVLDIVQKNPELSKINAGIQAKDYRIVDDRLHPKN